MEIPLSPEAVTGLRRTNTLLVENPDRKEFGLAHVFLLAQLENGRIIKTETAPAVYLSFLMTNQERLFPDPEFIRPVKLGADLEEISLTFEKAYPPIQ